MTTLRVRVWRAETIVGVADKRRWRGRSYECLARQRVDPVGGASASGMKMSDGHRISSIFCHLSEIEREIVKGDLKKGKDGTRYRRTEEKENGRVGVAEAFIDVSKLSLETLSFPSLISLHTL
jgi:hypothetical protein